MCRVLLVRHQLDPVSTASDGEQWMRRAWQATGQWAGCDVDGESSRDVSETDSEMKDCRSFDSTVGCRPPSSARQAGSVLISIANDRDICILDID